MKTRCIRVTIFVAVIVLMVRNGEAKPAIDEAPVKFTLDTGKSDVNETTAKPVSAVVGSTLQNGMEWLERMADTLRFGRGRLVNSVAIARNILAERLEELTSETRNNVAGAIGAANDIIVKSRSTLQSYEKAPFAQFLPPKTRETVRLENEQDQAFFEKRKTNPISTLLENIVKPKPIVDNLKEEEKYGNKGDQFIGVGRALVNGFEGLSNLFNVIVDLPVSAAKKTSRGLTEALNQIGSRFIGLQ